MGFSRLARGVVGLGFQSVESRSSLRTHRVWLAQSGRLVLRTNTQPLAICLDCTIILDKRERLRKVKLRPMYPVSTLKTKQLSLTWGVPLRSMAMIPDSISCSSLIHFFHFVLFTTVGAFTIPSKFRCKLDDIDRLYQFINHGRTATAGKLK
jgi:hypothetical protein